ncbi:MAG: TetR/AcrR family transcriptional regulator [Clostridiales bacterium]|jgi:AcrR family transcriptional regulator|nr:TetR/AcrR family transcriptional regulator [Clostridiales bacterium]
MPTSTFLNLPPKKHKKIIAAIKNELARVPFDKVSINKIVQEAGISRGSFYQYFEDKTDMLNYILSDYYTQMLWDIKKSLRDNNGDIFKMFGDILDFTIQFVDKEKINGFCNNLFSDIKIIADIFSKHSPCTTIIEAYNSIKDDVNLDLLELNSKTDFLHMFEILLSVSRDAVVELFLDTSEYEAIKAKYLNKLELLKRGFQRRSC